MELEAQFPSLVYAAWTQMISNLNLSNSFCFSLSPVVSNRLYTTVHEVLAQIASVDSNAVQPSIFTLSVPDAAVYLTVDDWRHVFTIPVEQ
jgi:hypothetical protein